MLHFCIIIVLFVEKIYSSPKLQTNSQDLVRVDEFIEIYRKHFILARSLSFTILQDYEHKGIVNNIAKQILPHVEVSVKVQELQLSPKVLAKSHPFIFKNSSVPNPVLHDARYKISTADFKKIKALSSDCLEGYIVLVWDVNVLLTFLHQNYQMVLPQSRASYAFLFVKSACSSFKNLISHVLKLTWTKHGIVNIIAQSLNWCNRHKIYIFNPFVKLLDDSWGVTHSYTKEEILNNFLLMTTSFTNFHQFPIKVALFERIPTAVRDLPKLLRFNVIYKNLSSSGNFGGLDGCLLGTIAEKLNFEAIVEFVSDTYGRAYSNGSFSGTLNSLVNHKVHYSANGWFLTDYQTQEIEFTVPYSYDQVCVVVPKALKVPHWKSLLYCFKSSSWLLICIVSLISFIFWFLLNLRKQTVVSFWELYSVFIGIPVRLNLSSNQYFFLASCLTFNLIIMGIIQGSFFTDFTTVVFYKDINTLEELDKSQLPIATSSWYLDYDTSDLVRSLRKRKVAKTDNAFNLAATQRNLAILYRKQDVEFLVNLKHVGQDGLPKLYIVNECLNYFLIVNVLRKGSPFLIIFNDVITKLFEGGLTQKWYRDVGDAVVIENLINLKIKKPNYVCELEDVQLAFYILFFGYIVATVFFLVEFIK